jgi:hypothetical protein
MMDFSSSRVGSSPLLPREWRGGLTGRPACLHTLSHVLQDCRDQRVQPLHLLVPPCPPKGARHEPAESPEFPSNRPQYGVA